MYFCRMLNDSIQARMRQKIEPALASPFISKNWDQLQFRFNQGDHHNMIRKNQFLTNAYQCTKNHQPGLKKARVFKKWPACYIGHFWMIGVEVPSSCRRHSTSLVGNFFLGNYYFLVNVYICINQNVFILIGKKKKIYRLTIRFLFQ